VKFTGFVAIEKSIGASFYWGYFPITVHRYGVAEAFTRLFLMQFVASIIFWLIYDRVSKGRDLIGVAGTKKSLFGWWHKILTKIRIRFGWWNKMLVIIRNRLNFGQKSARCIDIVLVAIRFIFLVAFRFFLLSWQLIPPVVLLCVRTDGKRMRAITEITLIALSTLIATLWWTAVSKGVLRLIFGV
jgi:hypothetical protein